MSATHFTGKDFAFLITAPELTIPPEDFDRLMTPDSIPWTKINHNGGNGYQVGKDSFSYTRENDGFQMQFNPEIKFEKARKIVEEVADKLSKHMGMEVEVLLRS